MLARRIANRYATALFDLAVERNTVEAWEQELATLAAILRASPDLYAVLTHPEITLEHKKAVVRRALEGRLDPAILSTLYLLLRRGHKPDFEILHAIFTELWEQHRHVMPVTVCSAAPLSEQQARALASTLARRTGATIQMEHRVDPELIAGMIITIGDRVIDASARHALDHLREAMHG